MLDTNYDEWSRVYDKVYSYVTEDIPFYVEEARKSGGPILELGCGTGRVTIPIARTGLKTVGLDISSEMLTIAKQKGSDLIGDEGPLTLLQSDMRNFCTNQHFNLIIIPFRGFLSLTNVGDQALALDNIKQHLNKNGRLIFNAFVPDLDMLAQEEDQVFHLRDVINPEDGGRIVLWHQSSYDHYNQIIDTRMIIEELDSSGTMNRRMHKDFRLRYAHRWEIEHLLGRYGYEIIDLFGDFGKSAFDETSSEMIWVVKPA